MKEGKLNMIILMKDGYWSVRQSIDENILSCKKNIIQMVCYGLKYFLKYACECTFILCEVRKEIYMRSIRRSYESLK